MLEERVSVRQAAAEELRQRGDRLEKVVRTQASRIRELTSEWTARLTDAPPHELRSELLRAHLEQVRDLLPGDEEAQQAARGHTEIALGVLGISIAPVSKAFVDPFVSLSNRERQIVDLLVEGYSTKEIGFELELAVSTISTHRKRIMDKLGVDHLSSIIKLALGHGE